MEQPSHKTRRDFTKTYADSTASGVFCDPTTRTQYATKHITTGARRIEWRLGRKGTLFWGDTDTSTWYAQNEKAQQDLLATGKPVGRVVGHSRGGSVALELPQQQPTPLKLCGAPVLGLTPLHNCCAKSRTNKVSAGTSLNDGPRRRSGHSGCLPSHQRKSEGVRQRV